MIYKQTFRDRATYIALKLDTEYTVIYSIESGLIFPMNNFGHNRVDSSFNRDYELVDEKTNKEIEDKLLNYVNPYKTIRWCFNQIDKNKI